MAEKHVKTNTVLLVMPHKLRLDASQQIIWREQKMNQHTLNRRYLAVRSVTVLVNIYVCNRS